MAAKPFTIEDLKRILVSVAGADEGIDLDGDILDTEFDVLGYESLALLEAGGHIEREYGISLDDEAIAEITTPRAFIDAVNAQLRAARVG